MQEAQIVGDLLFPADQEASCAVDPGVGSLDDPASRFSATACRPGGVFAFARNVGDVVPSFGSTPDGFGVVAFVGAEMLFLARRGTRTPHRNAGQRFLDQFLIMHISAGNSHANRHASPVGEHRTLDAQLAPIGRVFPGFFPHPAALWSSPHPNSATATRCLAGSRIPPVPRAIVSRTRLLAPTLENTHESHCKSRTGRAWPSTGSQYAARRKFRSPHLAAAIADAHHYNSVCNLGATARSVPTANRKSGETLTHNTRPLAMPPGNLKTIKSQDAQSMPVVICTVFG